jgi:hypothetical protein
VPPVEHFFGGRDPVGADGVGRLRYRRGIALEIAAALRFGPSVAAAHGQVSALGAGGSLALLFRIAGGRRASLAAGAASRSAGSSSAPSPRPAPRDRRTATCSRSRACGSLGRLALGRWLHGTAASTAASRVRGVEATDTARW